MYPAAFNYFRPTSVAETIGLLQQHPEGKIVAGGHSLLPMMKLRLAEPESLIDIGRISGLSGIKDAGDHITIGPLTTYHEVINSDVITSSLPVLADAANQIGDIQVRNRGTIGGSCAHADPASDMPALMLALNATFKATGPNGDRSIDASDFFVDFFTTALEADEVLTEINVPKLGAHGGAAYAKFSHPASGYAVVGVAAVVDMNGGNIGSARIGITGTGPVAYRATAVEQALAGKSGDSAIEAAASHATDGVDVNGDIFASPEYRAHLAQVYTKRAVAAAVANAG